MQFYMVRKTFIFTLVIMFLVSCSQELTPRRPEQSKKMHDEKIECPEGAHVEYIPWSETGWAKVCKMNHGKFTAWRGDNKVIDGQFDNGKKVGIWTYYDKDGKEEKTVNY